VSKVDQRVARDYGSDALDPEDEIVVFPTRERLDSNRKLITCGVEVRLAATLG
jgi:hypothetical protein